MDLMPVSNIEVFDSSWSKFGAWRWIGHRSVTSSCSSGLFRGDPTTSNTVPRVASPTGTERSEEHTSELQSRGHLVCRLLLEKKTESQRPPDGELDRPVSQPNRTHHPVVNH